MSVAKKKSIRKSLKKRTSTTVIVVEGSMTAKDTLFPEKVARANKILSKIDFRDSGLRF